MQGDRPQEIRTIEKLIVHIDKILQYCRSCHDLSELEADTMRSEAVAFNLLQIGEIAKEFLSDEIKPSLTSIPWRLIYGLRNRIVHGYDKVDMSMIWETVKNDIPKLKEDLQKILQDIDL